MTRAVNISRIAALTLALAILTAAPAAHAAPGKLTPTRAAQLVEQAARIDYGDLGSYVRATCTRTARARYSCRYVVADGVTCGATDNTEGTWRGRATVAQRHGFHPRVTLRRPTPGPCPASGAPRP